MLGKYSMVAVAAVLMAAGTGCMMSPLDGDYIGSIEKKVSFSGATTVSEEWVTIQAKRPSTGTWHAIKHVKTGTLAYNAYGTDWYVFGTSAVIPSQYWKFSPGGTGNMEAEVRAIANSGPAGGLVTFNQAFNTYFDPDESQYSLNDLLTYAGNGPSATVSGTVYIP